MDCIQFMKCHAVYAINTPDSSTGFARIAALEWMEGQMETTNNNQPMLIDGLSCVWGGSKIYYSTVNVEDMNNINQLACPKCGIIMRSPPTDENGEWLKNHWKKTHAPVETLTAGRDEYKRRTEAAEMNMREWELFSLLSAVWYGKDAYFRQNNGIVYSRISGEYMTFDQAVDEFVYELRVDNDTLM